MLEKKASPCHRTSVTRHRKSIDIPFIVPFVYYVCQPIGIEKPKYSSVVKRCHHSCALGTITRFPVRTAAHLV